MLSVIVPVYHNAGSIPELVQRLSALSKSHPKDLEVVFVLDGDPDGSENLLRTALQKITFRALMVTHSKNFGSFEAIRTGLAQAAGPYFAVMAADLQEPAELVEKMHLALVNGANVVLGTRESRGDSFGVRTAARLFWWLYRKFQPEMPIGGADVFACDKMIRDQLLILREKNSTLVGLLVWLGYRRVEIPYSRLPRKIGETAWTFSRKRRYFIDSIFAFSDLPIRLMLFCGGFGILTAIVLSAIVIAGRLTGFIAVPGYAATVLIVIFFGGLNLMGLGIVGAYLWRTFENTKDRPLSCVQAVERFGLE